MARLFRVGVDGTGYRELYGPYPSAGIFEKVAWTSRWIYFSEGAAPSGPWHEVNSGRVMRIAPDGGSPAPVYEFNGSDGASTFDISPDGSRIALHPGVQVPQAFDPLAGPRNELVRMFFGPIKAGNR